MADAALCAATSGLEENPPFLRLWADPEPPPRPLVSIGEAARRVLAFLNPSSEERLARQIVEAAP